MHFDLGQPQDRQLQKGDRPDVGVVGGFADGCAIPRLRGDLGPQLVESRAGLDKRLHHIGWALLRARMKRGRPLRRYPARIEGGRLSSQGVAGHPMAGLSPIPEMTDDVEPAPSRQLGVSRNDVGLNCFKHPGQLPVPRRNRLGNANAADHCYGLTTASSSRWCTMDIAVRASTSSVSVTSRCSLGSWAVGLR